MAITAVRAIQALGGGTIDGERTAQILYYVYSNDVFDGPLTILSASGVPRRGQMYEFGNEFDPYMFAQSANAQWKSREDSRNQWEVTVNYSTKGLDSDPQQDKQDPLDWKPKCSTSSQKTRRPMLFDSEQTLIASSAGEPYDPVQEKDETKFFIHIVRNVARSNVAFNATYKDAINLDKFWGNDARTVKVETPGITREMFGANGQRYYEETWDFAIEPRGWDLSLVDYGMYKVVGGVRTLLKDDEGNQLTSPALLDGNGDVLTPGDPPVYLPDFKPYLAKRFSALRLPNSFEDNR